MLAVVQNCIKVKPCISLIDYFLVTTRWVILVGKVMILDAVRNKMEGQLSSKHFCET